MTTLCENCLRLKPCTAYPIGFDKGTQYDPYRETLLLCNDECLVALRDHNLAKFHELYAVERQLNVGRVDGRADG